MYYLYIIKSQKSEWYYVGITSDINKRVELHNQGKVRSTKSKRTYKLVLIETYENRTEARIRELEIKGNWQVKKALIDNFKHHTEALSSNG